MEEQITRGRKRRPLIDRLREYDDEPVITKGKLKKLRHKFDEPIQESFEIYDRFGDDCE